MTNPTNCRRWPLAMLALCALIAISVSAGCKRSAPSAPPPALSGTTSQTMQPPATATIAPAPGSQAPDAENPPPIELTTTRVYWVRGEFLGVGVGRKAPAAAPAATAMANLLTGPNASEKTMGLHSEIPKGTRFLGLTISDGTATVNLSKRFESGGGTLSMTLRIAQVVDTLTQFKSVKRVAFKIDDRKVEYIGGEGIIVAPSVDRADFESALPPIMLESPLPKSAIGNPVRIVGTANVFEAQFVARITDAGGKVVAEQPVMASSGTGTRGTFNKLIKYRTPKHGRGSITVFEPSAKDGSETNKVTIPVNL